VLRLITYVLLDMAPEMLPNIMNLSKMDLHKLRTFNYVADILGTTRPFSENKLDQAERLRNGFPGYGYI